jgi:hypothetical protein
MALPTDTLPLGTYRAARGIYQPEDGQRLPVQDLAGQPLGDYISRVGFGRIT